MLAAEVARSLPPRCARAAARHEGRAEPTLQPGRCHVDKRVGLGACSGPLAREEGTYDVRGCHELRARVCTAQSQLVGAHRIRCSPWESLAFVSLILPFWAHGVGIGTIIGAADPLNFWTIVAAAAIGAALGDWLSYWLGYHYHAQIQNMWPLKNHPHLIETGHKFLSAVGRVGRRDRALLGPLRASVPIVAGITEMPGLKFQIANWRSAFLWAFVLLSPGKFGVRWLVRYFQ